MKGVARIGILWILLSKSTEARFVAGSFVVPPHYHTRIQQPQQHQSCSHVPANMVSPKKTTSSNISPVKRSNASVSNHRAPRPNKQNNKQRREEQTSNTTRNENSLKVTTKLQEMKQRANKGESLTRTFRFTHHSCAPLYPYYHSHYHSYSRFYRILL